MINILIPLAGKNQFFPVDEFPFPKPLIEFNGRTMIEHIIDNFSSIEGEKKFIFIVNSRDCKKYHLDNVLNILTENKSIIIKLNSDTKGAACSAMMASEFIDNNVPLIISNADQLFDVNLQGIISSFENSDCGVITFESIHPRWSYVKLDENRQVVETAEKRPISKAAIAGFYYFKQGSDFISAASRMIKKDANVDGVYYIAPCLNEMILNNKTINIFSIDNEVYHTFYTPQKIKEYEKLMSH
tara:strand:+ start:17290 stop:18018 length:729 start_codon:yes stop_codon:yes gene_type:complete